MDYSLTLDIDCQVSATYLPHNALPVECPVMLAAVIATLKPSDSDQPFPVLIVSTT